MGSIHDLRDDLHVENTARTKYVKISECGVILIMEIFDAIFTYSTFIFTSTFN